MTAPTAPNRIPPLIAPPILETLFFWISTLLVIETSVTFDLSSLKLVLPVMNSYSFGLIFESTYFEQLVNHRYVIM